MCLIRRKIFVEVKAADEEVIKWHCYFCQKQVSFIITLALGPWISILCRHLYVKQNIRRSVQTSRY